MGVTGLWKLIENAGKEVSLESLDGKVLAVDASILLNQAVKGMKDQPNAHIYVLFLRLCKLLTYKIKPIFVFDGGVPALKRQTIAARQRKRDEANVQANSIGERLRKAVAHQDVIDNLICKHKTAKPECSSTKQQSKDIFELPADSNHVEKGKEADDEYFELPIHNVIYADDFDISQVNINGEEFKSLPLEYQHEILEEVREHTKQQVSNAPLSHIESADDFSTFQVAKVLRSSQLSQKIEGLRKEMISTISEDGVESGSKVLQANRIMSEDATHYLLVQNQSSERSIETTMSISKQGNDQLSYVDNESIRKSLLAGDQIIISESLAQQSDETADGSVTGVTMEIDTNYESDIEFQNAIQLSLLDKDQSTDNVHTQAELLFDEDNLDCEAILSSSSGKCNARSSSIAFARKDNSNSLDDLSEIVQLSTATGAENSTLTAASNEVISESVATVHQKLHEEVDETHLKSTLQDIRMEQKSLADGVFVCSEKEKSTELDEALEIKSPLPNGLQINPIKLDVPISELSSNSVFPASIFDKPLPANQVDQSENQASIQEHQASSSHQISEEENIMLTKASINPEAAESLSAAIFEERKTLYAQLRKQETASQTISKQMTADAQELLQLFGVPFVVSPSEAEAQCAKLDELNLCDGVITDDSDAWLFGCSRILKNFFQQNKYVLSFHRDDIKRQFGLDREKMVALALVCGSDYTDGLVGAGPVTAMEIMSEFNSDTGIAALQQFKDWLLAVKQGSRTSNNAIRDKLRKLTMPNDSFPNPVVIDAYLNPKVDDSTEQFEWGKPDLDLLRRYATAKLSWTSKKVDDLICPVLKALNKNESQKTLDRFFSIQPTLINPSTDFQSKRLKNAISKIIGGPSIAATVAPENIPKSRVPTINKLACTKNSNTRKRTTTSRSALGGKTTSRRGKAARSNQAIRIVTAEVKLSESSSSDSN